VSIVTTVLAPVSEELFFRGLAYGPLFRKFGAAGAAVGSALLWAAAHGSTFSYISVVRMSWVLILGVVYAETYRRRESLIPTIAFHIIENTTAVLLVDWRYLPSLVAFSAVSTSLWIMSAVLFHRVRRRRRP